MSGMGPRARTERDFLGEVHIPRRDVPDELLRPERLGDIGDGQARLEERATR